MVRCINFKKITINSFYTLAASGPSTWVRSWIDFSHKYGMAYKTSEGCIGVCFNDQTNLIADPEMLKFHYYAKRANYDEKKQDYSFADPPEELGKKVKLALYLGKKLEIEYKEGLIGKILVKKWILTQHVVLFRMTNKLVQAYFRDQSEIFLCGVNKMVTFVNKNKEIRVCSVSNVMESENKEMIKRVKFIKEVLLGSVGEKNKDLLK